MSVLGYCTNKIENISTKHYFIDTSKYPLYVKNENEILNHCVLLSDLFKQRPERIETPRKIVHFCFPVW